MKGEKGMAETEFDRLVKTRRSYRKFKGEVPAKELVDQVVEAGLRAPSGRRKQTGIVVRIDDTAVRKELIAVNAAIRGEPPPGRVFDPFYGAPVILLVIAEKKPESTPVYDGTLTLGNMLLKAHELGLAGCWIHRAREEMEGPFGRMLLERLGLKGEYEGIGHLALGYPDGPEPQPYDIAPGRYLSV